VSHVTTTEYFTVLSSITEARILTSKLVANYVEIIVDHMGSNTEFALILWSSEASIYKSTRLDLEKADGIPHTFPMIRVDSFYDSLIFADCCIR